MIDDSLLGPGMQRGFSLWRKHIAELLALRGDAATVVSFPKSGRTWHRALLSHYISTHFLKVEPRSIDTARLTRQAGLGQVSYTHDGANFLSAIGPAHRFNADPFIWRRRKVLLLVRDPRDVLVSAYAHAKTRSNAFTGTLSQFVRHPFTGIAKILWAQRRWHSYVPRVPAVLVLHYEAIHEDPAAALTETLKFLGIPAVAEAVTASAQFAHFENLKKLESDGYFASGALRIKAADPDAMKVRVGKVGGYSSVLSGEDIAFIGEAVARIGDPLGSMRAG